MADEELTQQELRAVLSQIQIDKWIKWWLAGTLIVVMILFSIVAGYLVLAVRHDQKISDRSDCARQYSSLLSAKTNSAVFIGLEQNSQLAQALFNSTTAGTRPTQETIDNFGAVTAALKGALDVAAGRNGHPKLPTPDMAVEHGMTLDGKKYPSCPKVN